MIKSANVVKNILIDATQIPKNPVGAGIYISKLVKELCEESHEFNISILAHKNDFGLFGLDNKFNDKFLFCKDLGKGFRIISEQFDYPKIIQKNNISLYHGLHYSMPINKKSKVVTTIHDTTFYQFPQKHILVKRMYFRFFTKYSSNHSDHIIAVSENTKNDLINLFKIEPMKITTTHLGVDHKFQPLWFSEKFHEVKEKYDLPEKFILFVGLIEPRKNLTSLIRAYSQLSICDGSITNIHLVIAGRWGWESKNLLKLIGDLNLSNQIHFPGYIDQNDMPILFNLASVFVYPSFYEGFGLPVLEAMSCGTPVITSNISSMPEFVGKGGILINPNEIDDIVNAMQKIITNENLKNELRVNAIAQAKKFTWKATAQKTLEVYRKVLHGD